MYIHARTMCKLYVYIIIMYYIIVSTSSDYEEDKPYAHNKSTVLVFTYIAMVIDFRPVTSYIPLHSRYIYDKI